MSTFTQIRAVKTEINIFQGDSVKEMEKLNSDSIQLVVTSPPYDKLREYNGHNEWDFENTAKQLYRVLVSGGVACWNVNDSVVNGSETLTSFRQAIYFKDVVGFNVHDTMIYKKHGFSHPETRRYHSTFEYVFILSKGEPITFNPIKDRKNVTAGQSAWGTSTFNRPNGNRHKRHTQGSISDEFGMRHNVWIGNTRGQEEPCEAKKHPAMMPRWLARDLIRSFSNEGDVVLDPFAGSGTSGWEAYEMCRHAILIDKDPASFKMMTNRKSKLQPRLV